jgi:hypothetical protein
LPMVLICKNFKFLRDALKFSAFFLLKNFIFSSQ